MPTVPDTRTAGIFFALGDETRLSVLRKLGRAPALSATVLAEKAPVSRQAIVKHLQVLMAAGLVRPQRQGREVLYALESARLDEARAFLQTVSANWDQALDRLRKSVEAPPPRRRRQKST